jgi:hypothetical protein
MDNNRKIAIVKDGIVLEVMNTNDILASMFLDNVTFIDATLDNNMCKTFKGDTYDSATGKFDHESKVVYLLNESEEE